MILKSNLKNLKKVGVSVWVEKGSAQKLPNGNRSITFTVYDANINDVVKVVQKAFAEAEPKI